MEGLLLGDVNDAILEGQEEVVVTTAPATGSTTGPIDFDQLLRERPDVFRAFFQDYYGPLNDHHSTAWVSRVGGSTVQDYADYWYRVHGEAEGYVAPRLTVPEPEAAPEPEPQSAAGGLPARTTADGISLQQILHDRPDVYRSFYEEYYGRHNDRHSDAWANRVGGDTPEDYADYWYRTYGKEEGYGQEGVTPIDVNRILADRPDVYRAFYSEFYGPNNDRHSHAWEARVGDATPEAYASYWYKHHGRFEGYNQNPPAAPTEPEPELPFAPEIQPETTAEEAMDGALETPITTVGQSLAVLDSLTV